ncbi:MAG: hypothetical protein Kow009_09680 [Spirochaetales bacterium]
MGKHKNGRTVEIPFKVDTISSMDLEEGSVARKQILLVEDEAIVAYTEKKVLETEGYRVQHVSSGELAVEYIRGNTVPVDLVLMDIDLGPGMDGTEAAQRILEIRSIPILFLTSHTEREYVARAERISSYGYVVKHSGDLVLTASVKMAFRLAEAKQRIEEELKERIRAEEARTMSEARLKRAELAAKLGNWELDIGAGRISGSEGAARIYGLVGTEFPYAEVRKIPLPKYRPVLDTALKELIEEGKPYEVEFQIRAADTGEIKDIHSVAVYDPDRRVVFGVIQDVTARKRIEHALQDAEARWRFALEGAGHGVWDWHIPSNKVYFSPQWKRMLGYDEGEIGDRYEEWESRVHPEDLPAALNALEDMLERRADMYECEHRLRCKDGSYRWILDRGKVMEWDPEGKPVRAVGTHTDITEQKEAQEQIRHLLQEKELLLRETHHRVLNSLNVVRSLLSLQIRDTPSSDAVGTLREAQGRIDAMRVIYERLFRTRPSSGVSARSYLEDLVEDIREIFPLENRIEVRIEGEDVFLAPHQVSPLGIIVNELITNALKYAFTGMQKGNVRILLARKNGHVLIEVEDDGIGFPETRQAPDGMIQLVCGLPEEKPRSEYSMERKGFGLELVSVLVEQLGGSCVLESREGRGTRYRIEFTPAPIPGSGS